MDMDLERTCFSKAVHFGANGVQIRNHSFIQRKSWSFLANVLRAMPVRKFARRRRFR